jgi:predicted ATPase
MLGDVEAGYQLGQLGLRLLERRNIREYHAKILLAIHAFVTYRKDHLRETLPFLLEAYQSGLETGDLESAALALQLRTCHAYLSGQSLKDVERDMASGDQALAHLNQEAFRNYLHIEWQTVLNLMGHADTAAD